MLPAVRRLIVSIGVLIALSSPVFAQAHVTGTVRDADGKPLKGATITAQNPDAAPSTSTSTSDGKGRFSLLGLHSGTWRVTAQAPGFQPVMVVVRTRSLTTNPTLDLVMERSPQLSPAGPLHDIQASSFQQQLDGAAALAASGKDVEAIAAYRQIGARVPALTSIHLAVGALLERQHDVDGARVEYRALLAAEPDNQQAKAALERLGG